MSIVFNNNENILHAYTQSQVLFSRHNDTLKGVKMGKRTGKPMGRPSKGMVMSKFNIELAIKSTQSMGQAGLYMGVSKNTFKKYAKLHGLWAPIKSSKGIRHTGNVGSALKHDLKKILEGKNPNPYREDTLLKKGIHEGYLKCSCSNCSADFTHMNVMTQLPPLILDFLDRNPMNTKIENLRVLCFNCVYELASSKKGWYRHRTTVLGDILDDITPGEPALAIPKDETIEYMAFEEFQKLL